MFIPDPGSWFLPKDPGSRIQKQQQKRGVKKICCHNFLCSHKFHKIANYFSFEVMKKKIWANFQRIIELFTQKIVTKHSKKKYGFGIRNGYWKDTNVRLAACLWSGVARPAVEFCPTPAWTRAACRSGRSRRPPSKSAGSREGRESFQGVQWSMATPTNLTKNVLWICT